MTREVPERMYPASLDDARKALELAGEITGIRYDRNTIDYLAEEYATRNSLWSLYHAPCRKVIERMLVYIRSKVLEFCPLSKHIPDVTNEDLLEFLLYYFDCTPYIVAEKEADEDAYRNTSEWLVSVVYSGYSLRDWCNLLVEMKHAACCFSVNYIEDYLHKPHITGHISLCDPEPYRTHVRDLRELVRVILASAYLVEYTFPPEWLYKIESYKYKYLEVCSGNTGMSHNTILRLVDNFIPITFDLSGTKEDYFSRYMVEDNIKSLLKKTKSFKGFYWALCSKIGNRKLYRDILEAHKKAFDVLSLVVMHPDIKEAVIAFDEKTGGDGNYSRVMACFINDVLIYLVTEICWSRDLVDAARNIQYVLLSIRVSSEGILGMLADPYSRHRLLSTIIKSDKMPIPGWISTAKSILKDMDVLAEFPGDLVAAAILGMSASEAYSRIVSRGGVHL